MERRGFLKTLIAGTTSTGLILAASPAEVQAFGAVAKMPVMLSPERISPPMAVEAMGPVLYSSTGVAVAFVAQVHVRAEHVDVTSFGGGYRDFGAGPSRMDIQAIGLPEAQAWLRGEFAGRRIK